MKMEIKEKIEKKKKTAYFTHDAEREDGVEEVNGARGRRRETQIKRRVTQHLPHATDSGQNYDNVFDYIIRKTEFYSLNKIRNASKALSLIYPPSQLN